MSRSNKKGARKAKSTSSIAPIGELKRTTDRSKFNENTWVVFRNGNERKPMLFERKLTRDQVRCAYAKITGTAHDRTRSRRLSNY